jgi:hypothetical protein
MNRRAAMLCFIQRTTTPWLSSKKRSHVMLGATKRSTSQVVWLCVKGLSCWFNSDATSSVLFGHEFNGEACDSPISSFADMKRSSCWLQ